MYSYNLLKKIGNTPLIKIESNKVNNINLFVKLEYFNPTGSMKDRVANYVIIKGLENGDINNNSIIIESSSGNFGIALAAACKKNNLKFYCVVDSNINPINELLIYKLGANIIKVTEPDKNGGYLLNRIKKINQLLINTPNLYWINQYANYSNAEAYYFSLGNEICNSLERIDYVFIGVGSGGTITGISRKVKEKFPKAKIIAVDVEGSVIFGGKPLKRYIPGMGSSLVPEILKKAFIDDVVYVSEYSTIEACNELLKENIVFAGGSSGTVYYAIKKYFYNKKYNTIPNVVTIFADNGYRYYNTVYNESWCDKLKNNIF